LEGVRFEPADYIEPQLGAAGGTGPAGPKGDPGADGQPRKVLDEGAELPVRAAVNFVGAGVEATDDAANDRTKVTITGTAASGVDSAAIVSAVNASRDWLHADLWWLIGLVCALFFGYHLYRAVSPRA
jgi:hypothetical protein